MTRVRKTLNVITTSAEIGNSDEITLAHEIVHALQDQHFDLQQVHKDIQGDWDRDDAYTSLIEGDATALMVAYAVRYRKTLTPPTRRRSPNHNRSDNFRPPSNAKSSSPILQEWHLSIVSPVAATGRPLTRPSRIRQRRASRSCTRRSTRPPKAGRRCGCRTSRHGSERAGGASPATRWASSAFATTSRLNSTAMRSHQRRRVGAAMDGCSTAPTQDSTSSTSCWPGTPRPTAWEFFTAYRQWLGKRGAVQVQSDGGLRWLGDGKSIAVDQRPDATRIIIATNQNSLDLALRAD